MNNRKLDSKKIEEVGVTKVEDAFSRVYNVLTHLQTNDKGICTDGHIEVYEGASLAKAPLLGQIDVQVKATIAKPNSNHPKVRVSTDDLRKFVSVFHGVLFFKVFLHPDLTLDRIFYKQYLPYDVEKTLSRLKKDEQKSILDRFNPLPDDNRQLERLCLDFLRDSRKQGNIPLAIPGKQGHGGISIPDCTQYEITKTTYADEIPFSLSSLANGAYIYGVAENGEHYVLDKLEDICAVETERTCLIGSREHAETYTLSCGEDQEGHYLKFGGFSIRFGCSIRLKLTFTGGMRERLKDLRLAKEIQDTGELIINNQAIGRVHFDENFEQEVCEYINELEKFICLLDRLSISAVWDPDHFSQKEWNSFERLHRALVDNQAIELNGFDEELVNLNVDILGTRIKIFARRTNDGIYELFSPMDTSICFVPDTQETAASEDFSPVPGLLSLSVEDYKLAANIDANNFNSCLNRFPITEKNAGASNYKLLDMLTAYDKGAVCSSQLLDCCRLLADALLSLDPKDPISIINAAQVSRREGLLSEKEKIALHGVVISAKSSGTVKACAYSLLNNIDLAVSCIKTLSTKEQESLYGWPIARYLPARLN